MKLLLATAAAIVCCPTGGRAGDAPDDRLHKAIAAGLRIAQQAAKNYPEHRDCFSCHHQGLPMLAMVEARTSGVAIDAALLEAQAVFTHDFYKDRTAELAKGEGVGGRGMTAAYSLWALDLAGHPPDPVTAALTSYLLKRQEEDGRWQLQSHRPPLEESDAMTTFLAAYYMERFATADGRADVAASKLKAMQWLARAEVKSQEDLNAKLWATAELGGDQPEAAAELARLRALVLANQKEDGGWSQLPEMAADAYATGQTLYVLAAAGLAGDDPAVRRGVEFLLASQMADGSWLVETRSKPVQKFFDNGDPHGKNQFISVAATSWAVAALSRCAATPGISPQG